MAVRNKAKQTSNSRAKKPKAQEINPFELKFNRQKHDVLGRKVTKYDKGMPGLSRSKAIKKRKESLLVEYKKLGRGNKVVDRRIGENDPTMSFDEKMSKRFAFERQNDRKKPTNDLLADDDDDEAGEDDESVEELTHFGQSLSELENFKDPVMSDSDEDSESGRISAKVVGEEHFGGFLTKREPDGAPKDEKAKSWKERMEEIIAKSKKAKFERQAEKDKLAAVTKDLDADWKELQMLVSALKKNREIEEAAPKKPEEYDVVVKQLQFERKAQPTDRLKTEEELAKEEKEKLEKLEAERIRRMKGIDSESQPKYVSADDLDDGLVLGNNSAAEGSADTDSDDDNKKEEEDGSEDSDDEEEDIDDVNDADENDDEDEDDDVEGSSEEENSQPAKRVRFAADVECIAEPAVRLSPEEIEAAKKELPYTFTAPDSYDDLEKLFGQRDDTECLIIIDRLRKCHHPSLAEGNKDKLEKLFVLLLLHFGEVTQRSNVSSSFIDGLTRHLFELSQMSPVSAGQAFAEVIFAHYEEFCTAQEARNGRAVYPGLTVLLYLKLVSLLFPTSDRRHPIVTPAMLFMSHLLTQCRVNSTKDVAAGLFVCSLFADYVSLSKRLVPEVVNFLQGVLFLAAVKTKGKVYPVVQPFKSHGKNRDLLKIDGDCSAVAVEPMDISWVFIKGDKDYMKSDAFKVNCVAQTLKLVNIFTGYYLEIPSKKAIFAGIQRYAGLLPLTKYPEPLKLLHAEVFAKLDVDVKYAPLVRTAVKPQPLKLHEPKITENFDVRKKRTGTKEFNEKQKLVHKHKREFKGAVREVRKDTQFIARYKLQEQIARDTERKRKVKELLGQLAQQEGDCKALRKQHKS